MSVCTVLREQASTSKALRDISSSTYNNEMGSIMDSSDNTDVDYRIRQRLEASRQGMMQLDNLRKKHQKLMEEVRIRLPKMNINNYVHYKSWKASCGELMTNQIQPKLEEGRCDSPMSCCVSHRSSVSMDSGCVSLSSDLSINSSMPYGKYRKSSTEEKIKKYDYLAVDNNDDLPIVATAIESTTAVSCLRQKCFYKNSTRPASICTVQSDQRSSLILDSQSFAKITPPPIQRRFTAASRSETFEVKESLKDCFSDFRSTFPKDFSSNINRSSAPYLKLFHQNTSSPVFRIRTSMKPTISNNNTQDFPPVLTKKCSTYEDTEHSESISTIDRSIQQDDIKYIARPAVVVSRQQSAQSSQSSPVEARKYFLNEESPSFNFLNRDSPLTRRESSLSNETIVAEKPRRRVALEKSWRESEDL